MNTSFIHKYKPKKLDEFIIDSEIKNVISSFICFDNLNILLIGNPGSGKTAMINSIIKEYFKDIKHEVLSNNVLYINTLKEQGISYYRKHVKTFCQLPSLIKNKKKIVVLDDMDVINEQSQQVFRNCMDKYASNVFFIGSCLNVQKIIDSLQSRMEILSINNLSNENLYTIAKNIVINENINISDEVLKNTIVYSNNSFKILCNHLEKFKYLKCPITNNIACDACTSISYIDFHNYTQSCINNDLSSALNFINLFINKGFSGSDILYNYFKYIKNSKNITDTIKYDIIQLILSFIEIFNTKHDSDIELVFFTNNLIILLQST